MSNVEQKDYGFEDDCNEFGCPSLTDEDADARTCYVFSLTLLGIVFGYGIRNKLIEHRDKLKALGFQNYRNVEIDGYESEYTMHMVLKTDSISKAKAALEAAKRLNVEYDIGRADEVVVMIMAPRCEQCRIEFSHIGNLDYKHCPYCGQKLDKE